MTIAAAVVDRDVAEQLDPPGVAVDLDHRDVRAERERRRAGIEVELVREARLPCSRAGGRRPCTALARSAHDSDARGHARDLQPALTEDDVVGVRLEQCAASCFAWVEHLVARDLAARCRAICSEREPPVPPPCGISFVSDCRIVICSNGTPSTSLTIIENAVSCPCPCELVPTYASDRAVVLDLDLAPLSVQADRRA